MLIHVMFSFSFIFSMPFLSPMTLAPRIPWYPRTSLVSNCSMSEQCLISYLLAQVGGANKHECLGKEVQDAWYIPVQLLNMDNRPSIMSSSTRRDCMMLCCLMDMQMPSLIGLKQSKMTAKQRIQHEFGASYSLVIGLTTSFHRTDCLKLRFIV